MQLMQALYHYSGLVTKVYDGDTITVNVDLGFNVSLNKSKFRLARINTPEIRGAERPEGLISRDWLRDKILNKTIRITTIKDKKGKYGRWIADIYLDDLCLNDELVNLGLAEYVTY